MANQSTSGSLIDDLEAIRYSLDKIAKSEPVIPTLEEIVDKRTPTSVNPENPFLSSSSLSELLKIRNDAEARAAHELAQLKPIILAGSVEEVPSKPATPDPEEIMEQMEAQFGNWIENSVSQYMALFENDLRNQLQQDFRELVSKWYEDHELPIPESFAQRMKEETEQQTPEQDEANPSLPEK